MKGNFNKYVGEENSNYKDGRTGTRLYNIYRYMKTRCYNPNADNYKHYGGRGIKICQEWLDDFSAFKEWSLSHGYNDDLTIERLDVNGNYEPNNCAWVTRSVQANNTRVNHFITLDGITKTLTEWARYFNINARTVKGRLNRGWDVVRAFTEPVDLRYGKRGGVNYD